MDQTTTDQLTAAVASFGLIAGIIGIVSIVFAVIVWWRISPKRDQWSAKPADVRS